MEVIQGFWNNITPELGIEHPKTLMTKEKQLEIMMWLSLLTPEEPDIAAVTMFSRRGMTISSVCERPMTISSVCERPISSVFERPISSVISSVCERPMPDG